MTLWVAEKTTCGAWNNHSAFGGQCGQKQEPKLYSEKSKGSNTKPTLYQGDDWSVSFLICEMERKITHLEAWREFSWAVCGKCFVTDITTTQYVVFTMIIIILYREKH